MLEQYKSENVLFIDVETVPISRSFDLLDEEMQMLWTKQSKRISYDDETPAELYDRAGICAEFGKIVCVSVGGITIKNGERYFKVKSFYGDDEKSILQEFAQVLNIFSSKGDNFLCGHNVKEFDFPFICRRMIINGVKLPSILDVSAKKPWEIQFIDTMELWKFGDFKYRTSLALLTKILGIPTPKDDIDGSEVAQVYYEENNIERIVHYCEKDVLATAQLFLRFKNEPLIKEDNIIKR
ncbi:3'-5' exonuclease [Marinilabiliaceae bacterium ANBcel2]|nr:3'-5' exonuclease [Marinilabiliaceae bacterium ANBcel2]